MPRHVDEAAIAQALGERLAVRKFQHAPREIIIRPLLAPRHELPQFRQHLTEVEAIQRSDPALRLRELQDRDTAARLRHAHHLGDAAVGVGDVAKAERHRRGSEKTGRPGTATAGRRPRESGSDPRGRASSAGPAPASAGRSSAPDDRHLAASGAIVRQGQVAGAGAEIEDRLEALGRHELHGPPAPVAIDVQAQDVIEQVVHRRNRAEHGADPLFALVDGDGFAHSRGTARAGVSITHLFYRRRARSYNVQHPQAGDESSSPRV